MAPKKVMKAMKVKSKTLMKGPKPKSESASSKKATGKGKQALMKGNKTKLTKSQLDKLGKLSLKEKVEHATASADTAEEAAQNLKEIIKPNERGQIWSKHQTAMKGDKEAQEEHDALNKTQKGLASSLWFVENQSKKFFNSTATFGTKHTLIKGDTWKTEKQMIDQFGDELQLHIQSGRIQWRSDPYTPDVYQYKDLGDITGSTEVTRKRQHSMGVENAATADHEDHFMKEWGKGGHHMLQDAEASGKGQRASGSKGGRGGNGSKGNRAPLAITNGDGKDKEKEDNKDDEKTEWNKCLVKAQKAKESCILAISNMEEAISNCHKAGRLTKAARKDYEDLMKDVQQQAEQLKKLLKLKGNQYSLQAAKDIIVGAANKTKELKDEIKECVGLANKAGSRASTKKWMCGNPASNPCSKGFWHTLFQGGFCCNPCLKELPTMMLCWKG